MNLETLNALDKMRVATDDFLANQKLSASRIVDTVQNPRPVRLLAFDFYGTSEDAQDLIDVNDDINVSYYSGDVKVLTDDDS